MSSTPNDSNLLSHPEPLADGILVCVTAEIDFNLSPRLRDDLAKVIDAHRPARLIIDLSQVPYMDSSGVATLVETLQIQRKAGGKLVLCSLQPKVLGIFQISRLDSLFLIADDPAAAATAE